MKQTAVEWLEEQIECISVQVFDGFLTFKEFMEQKEKLLKEAKEMEKEQRIKAYQLGYDTGYKVCEMKFNGLFKSE
jgi:hypothetical protein